jgi:N6-L-threonylcarbamoyladenine synthase
MRKTLIERVRNVYPGIGITETHGYITKYLREKHKIPKSHTNDALCISGNPEAKRVETSYLIKPIRSHNRQIHKASIGKGGYRKLNQAPKYVHGYQLFYRVRIPDGREGFVFGRRASGSFDVRTLDGERLSAGVSYKKLTLLDKRKPLLVQAA